VLRLHDTATGAVRPLEQREPGAVTMYVCGLTVYDVPHVGHGRAALAFDVLRRYLEFSGLRVNHVSNVTDIDDKIINRAAAEGRSEQEVAGEYEKLWWHAVDALGVLRPVEVPHATAYVEKMVALVSALVESGAAYETDDGVYLSVDKVAGYGLLAHQSLDSLRAGARVEVGEQKRSPLDFALWKKAKPGEPTWPSPWGPGRPGWHTECVVMSLELLGDGFDLHGGGIDLAFPHHENERAQALCWGRDFAHHWMHHGMVTVGAEKMSKSLGNFTTLTELLERTDGRAYRLLVLRAHYRSPIEVNPATLADAVEGLARLDALARRFGLDPTLGATDMARARGAGVDANALTRFAERMDDDLDTPGAVSVIFELVRRANAAADAGDDGEGRRLAMTVVVLAGALGLQLTAGVELDDRTTELVRRRDEARAGREWEQADDLRRQLEAEGWVVEDTTDGTKLHRRPG